MPLPDCLLALANNDAADGATPPEAEFLWRRDGQVPEVCNVRWPPYRGEKGMTVFLGLISGHHDLLLGA